MSDEVVRPVRSRAVPKLLYFSDEEWARVEERMSRAGETVFSRFARRLLLDGEIHVDSRSLDVDRLRRVLGPVGNNVNQIARQVNIDSVVSLEQLVAVEKLLSKIDREISALLLGDE